MVEQEKLNCKKIMVVDDDQFSTLLTRLKLKKYVGENNIQVISTIEKAIEYLEDQINGKTESVPDLILLETMMDEGKGWDFIKYYEEIMKYTDIQIKLVILTSSQFFSDFRRSTSFGRVDGFLIKPLQMDQLIKMISEEEIEKSQLLLNSFIA